MPEKSTKIGRTYDHLFDAMTEISFRAMQIGDPKLRLDASRAMGFLKSLRNQIQKERGMKNIFD